MNIFSVGSLTKAVEGLLQQKNAPCQRNPRITSIFAAEWPKAAANAASMITQ